ncbi:MAG: hypothetical protein ACPGTU_09940 [Myxococcota bacterium]
MRHLWLLSLLMLGCRVMKPGDSGQSKEPTDVYIVAETSTGRVMIVNAETSGFNGEICLSEVHEDLCSDDSSTLAKPCLMFGVTHTSVDDVDQLLMTYTLRNPEVPFAPGAIANINIQHPPVVNWIIDTIKIPAALQTREGLNCEDLPETAGCHLYGSHNTIALEDGRLLVADTSNSRILWLLPPNVGTTATVDDILSMNHPEWSQERYPNQVQPLSFNGRQYLLLTHKGSMDEQENPTNWGSIVLWDVTDTDRFTKVWRYPETGYLSAVHQGLVQDTPNGSLLIYAHSYGAATDDSREQDGSIGFAQFRGEDPPLYLADGIYSETPFGFTREVEWNDDLSQLIVTDSGCENSQADCDRAAQILAIDLPILSEAGTSGAFSTNHEHQRLIELEVSHTLVTPTVELPFDTDRIPLENQGAALRKGLGGCESP